VYIEEKASARRRPVQLGRGGDKGGSVV